jgi:hypothetical protein
MANETAKGERVGGIAVICGLVTGFASLGVALLALFNADWSGTGVCLIAAGLAFGLIANAVWRQ